MTAVTLLLVFAALWMVFSALLIWALCIACARRDTESSCLDQTKWGDDSANFAVN